MFGKLKRDWGRWAAVLGFLMLAGAIGTTGWDVWGANPGCPDDFVADPPGSRKASAWIYAEQGEIRLGRDACLNLKPESFFASERAALKEQTDAIAAAEAALKPLAPAAADPAAVKARSEATARLAKAQAALAQLPRRRKVFLLFDDLKVPTAVREVDIMGERGRPWIPVTMPLRADHNAGSDDGQTWRKILAGPTDLGRRKVRISVAVAEAEDKPPVVRAVLRPQATLQVFDLRRLLTGVLGLALLTAGVIKRGWNTGLLRDGGPGTTFSLGRVQMGWWLVLALGGFLYIWVVTGQWEGVVTSGVIGLLGISAATGVAARMVDAGTGPSSPPDRWPSPPDRQASFWADIVNDGDGAGLHRIQLIAWTVVLGAVFIWTVVWTFGFPDFDPNLLLLAGIAGGTYLGFKFQEADPAGGTRSPPD